MLSRDAVPAASSEKGETPMRFVCKKCLRLWDAYRVANRATCPFCGGALSDH